MPYLEAKLPLAKITRLARYFDEEVIINSREFSFASCIPLAYTLISEEYWGSPISEDESRYVSELTKSDLEQAHIADLKFCNAADVNWDGWSCPVD